MQVAGPTPKVSATLCLGVGEGSGRTFISLSSQVMLLLVQATTFFKQLRKLRNKNKQTNQDPKNKQM